MREAPAIAIASALVDLGARVAAYDPEAAETAKALLGESIAYAPDAVSALDKADALIVATEWPEFRRPDLDDMKKRLAAPVVFDGRNLYDPDDMTRAGFVYYSIGRPPAGAGVWRETPPGAGVRRPTTPADPGGGVGSPMASFSPI